MISRGTEWGYGITHIQIHLDLSTVMNDGYIKLTWNSNLGGMLKLTFRQTAFVTPVVVFIENWSPYNNNHDNSSVNLSKYNHKRRTGSTTSNGSGSGAKSVWQNGNP